MAHASGYFKSSYAQDLVLVETRAQRAALGVLAVLLVGFPFLASPFLIDLASQVFIAVIGAISLMLLTGFAGQISLGHAGLLAAGAFTTGILVKEVGAGIWITLPASALVGVLLGFIFGLPSLRLKGLYLAVSTLALHFIIIFVGGEYETIRGHSTGVIIEAPRIGAWELSDPTAWYFVLLGVDLLVLLFSLNLLRSRTGRAWAAIRDHETVAAALGISVPRYKLSAFVISSSMTTVAGCLFAYYHGFVAVEAFSLFLMIEYLAMVIIGGLGSLLGAVLGVLISYWFLLAFSLLDLVVYYRIADLAACYRCAAELRGVEGAALLDIFDHHTAEIYEYKPVGEET